MTRIQKSTALALSILALGSLILTPTIAEAQRRGGGGGAHAAPQRSAPQRSGNNSRNVRSNANTNINNTHINNNNVNVNRNVNVNVDDRHGYHDDWDDHYHPIATAAAVTATVAVTAAVVGSIVNTVPPGCSTMVVNGISYSQCGSTWYQPQYVGSNVQYVVVAAPR